MTGVQTCALPISVSRSAKRIEFWGSKRAIDLGDGALDYRGATRRESPRPEGFVDASALLGPGVFMLLAAGEVVYIGRASKGMLAKLAALRDSGPKPSWLPRVKFDEVLIRRVHPDQLSEVYTALLAEFRPSANPDLVPPAPLPRFERRL